MSSVIRIGTVSKVNYEDGTIEVAYEDRDGSVTDEICVVSNALYRMHTRRTTSISRPTTTSALRRSAQLWTAALCYWNT